MKKRGTYIILTGCASTQGFGGPSWESEGAGPTLKEVLSNELSVSPDVAGWPQEIYMPYGTSNNPFQCDFGDDSDTDIFGQVPVTGTPMKDVKSFVHEKLSYYDCELPIQVLDHHELWSSYKTLNFKKFLMSRGFDVEIVDYETVGYTGSFMSGFANYKSNYQEITGKNPQDIEYILIVGTPNPLYSWQGGYPRDDADRYPAGVCDGASGIMRSQAFNGAAEGDSNNNTDIYFGEGWYDHPYTQQSKLSNAVVGRWSVTNITKLIDIGWRIVNTIEYHTNEAQKHVYYNPSLDNQNLLNGYCSRSSCMSQEDCEANGFKWMESEPGYQYERIMAAYNNSALTNVYCNPAIEDGDSEGNDNTFNLEDPYELASLSQGIDFEPPVSRNPEFVKRYKRGVNKEEYIQLMRETDAWNEENPGVLETGYGICDDGYYWDIVEERCRIEPAGSGARAFVSPANVINWLRRRWDDLGLYMLMWGNKDPNAGGADFNFTEAWVHGTSVFQYRGAGDAEGPSDPELKFNTWFTEYSQYNPMKGVFNPMVGLSFVCDTCDYHAGYLTDGHCFCDHMTHSKALKGQIKNLTPGVFVAWIGLSELHSEAKWNNYFVGNFWRYMFGEVSENYIAARNEIRGWEPIRNQEIGYALDQCKFGLDSEPNLSGYDNVLYYCGHGSHNCDDHYRKSYNILGDPSIAFYIGKPKKIHIESGYAGTYLNLREGITLPDLDFTISLGSGHAGVRLDEAVGVVLYNRGDEVNEDWITLTKSYSENNGIMEFSIPSDELPAGEVELFIQINRYQHWPVNFRVYYNS